MPGHFERSGLVSSIHEYQIGFRGDLTYDLYRPWNLGLKTLRPTVLRDFFMCALYLAY